MKKDFDPIGEGAVFLIDKPSGWTSFDVVAELRSLLKKRYGVRKLKVGHAGTLDPMATGLLICCSGRMTKSIHRFQDAEKEYVGRVRFGYSTASCDADSEFISEHSTEGIDRESIEAVLPKFRGKIEQVPPSHSAVRVGGKRAYEEARKGKDPGLGARSVEVHDIRIESFQAPELELRIRCSKGTYIRSIARDLGKELKSGAYLSALRRTRIGEDRVDDAHTMNDLREFLQQPPESALDPGIGN